MSVMFWTILVLLSKVRTQSGHLSFSALVFSQQKTNSMVKNQYFTDLFLFPLQQSGDNELLGCELVSWWKWSKRKLLHHREETPLNAKLQEQNKLQRDVCRSHTGGLYFLNTELNTFNHSEELKGLKKIKRSQHKTHSGLLHAFLIQCIELRMILQKLTGGVQF